MLMCGTLDIRNVLSWEIVPKDVLKITWHGDRGARRAGLHVRRCGATTSRLPGLLRLHAASPQDRTCRARFSRIGERAGADSANSRSAHRILARLPNACPSWQRSLCPSCVTLGRAVGLATLWFSALFPGRNLPGEFWSPLPPPVVTPLSVRFARLRLGLGLRSRSGLRPRIRASASPRAAASPRASVSPQA